MKKYIKEILILTLATFSLVIVAFVCFIVYCNNLSLTFSSIQPSSYLTIAETKTDESENVVIPSSASSMTVSLVEDVLVLKENEWLVLQGTSHNVGVSVIQDTELAYDVSGNNATLSFDGVDFTFTVIQDIVTQNSLSSVYTWSGVSDDNELIEKTYIIAEIVDCGRFLISVDTTGFDAGQLSVITEQLTRLGSTIATFSSSSILIGSLEYDLDDLSSIYANTVIFLNNDFIVVESCSTTEKDQLSDLYDFVDNEWVESSYFSSDEYTAYLQIINDTRFTLFATNNL